MKVYSSSFFKHLKSASEKLLIETYFDMSVTNFLQVNALQENDDEFETFFHGLGNKVNMVLFMIYAVLLTVIGIYYHMKIYRNQDNF